LGEKFQEQISLEAINESMRHPPPKTNTNPGRELQNEMNKRRAQNEGKKQTSQILSGNFPVK